MCLSDINVKKEKLVMKISKEIKNKYQFELKTYLAELDELDIKKVFNDKDLLLKIMRNYLGDEKEINDSFYKNSYYEFIESYVKFIYSFNVEINVTILMQNLCLREIIKLKDQKPNIDINKYLNKIGFDSNYKISESTYERHAFNTMQFTDLFPRPEGYWIKNPLSLNELMIKNKLNNF